LRYRAKALAVPLLAVVLLVPFLPGDERGEGPAAPPSPIVFAAAGDHSWGTAFDASLAALSTSGAEFYLALGDLSYGSPGTEPAWCSDVTAVLGPSYPFQLVSGNHEEDAGPNGWIGNFAPCLPDRLGSTGTYAAQYFFDYPAGNPLVRVLMIAPDLTTFGTYRSYTSGDADYDWVGSTIDGARVAGIPWVVVGMHKNCITTGDKTCSIGTDIFDLLMAKKVDLILQGHDHNVQRSKQLDCAAITINGYDPACVVDDGADGLYTKGAGMIVNIGGSFGQCCYVTDPADPEAPYFAAINGDTNGFWKYAATVDTLTATFVATYGGSFTDTYVITGSSPSTPAPPTGVDAAILGNDVALGWIASSPDADVDHYEVWKGTAYSPTRAGYGKGSPNLPRGTSSWVDVGAVTAGGMMRPDADTATGVWGPGPLWSALDDTSDADFITASGAGSGEVALAAIGDPMTSGGHILRFRARVTSGGGPAEQMRVELYQGITLLASGGTLTVSRGVFATYAYVLTAAQADAILDYTDLRLRFVVVTIGGGEAIDLAWAELATPAGPPDLFYAVYAVSLVGASASPGQAAKMARVVPAGPSLLSVPLLVPVPGIQSQFQGTLTWSLGRHFDSGDGVDPWKAAYLTRYGDLSVLDPSRGVWVEVPAGGEYRVSGRVPCSTAIGLRAGWNLVGFPSMTVSTVATATAGLPGPIQVEGLDASAGPYSLQRLGPASLLEPGKGYWIHSPAAQTWTVVNDPAPTCA